MFTEKFTKLDNDFITVWSGFLYGEDYDLISKQLTTLAEMGQIDAMAKHYQMGHKIGDNPTIDNLVDNIKVSNMTAKECHAKACKAYIQDREKLNLLEEGYKNSCFKFGASSAYALHNNPSANTEKIKDAIKNTQYAMLAQKCIRMAFDEACNNRCMEQEALEWTYEVPENYHFDTTMKKNVNILQNNALDLRRSLKQAVDTINTSALDDEEFKTNKHRSPDSQLAFAYAKHFTMFPTNPRDERLGRYVLYNLKARGLSPEFRSRLNSKYPEDFQENETPKKAMYDERDNYRDYAKESEDLSNKETEQPKYRGVMNIKEM